MGTSVDRADGVRGAPPDWRRGFLGGCSAEHSPHALVEGPPLDACGGCRCWCDGGLAERSPHSPVGGPPLDACGGCLVRSGLEAVEHSPHAAVGGPPLDACSGEASVLERAFSLIERLRGLSVFPCPSLGEGVSSSLSDSGMWGTSTNPTRLRALRSSRSPAPPVTPRATGEDRLDRKATCRTGVRSLGSENVNVPFVPLLMSRGLRPSHIRAIWLTAAGGSTSSISPTSPAPVWGIPWAGGWSWRLLSPSPVSMVITEDADKLRMSAVVEADWRTPPVLGSPSLASSSLPTTGVTATIPTFDAIRSSVITLVLGPSPPLSLGRVPHTLCHEWFQAIEIVPLFMVEVRYLSCLPCGGVFPLSLFFIVHQTP